MDYVHQSRENYNSEQIQLYQRMQDYKKQAYEESRFSLSGPYGSPRVDFAHPFSRISNEVADIVMESAANGKVFYNMTFPFLRLFTTSQSVLLLAKRNIFESESSLFFSFIPFTIIGSNHSARTSFKTILQFESWLEKKVFCSRQSRNVVLLPQTMERVICKSPTRTGLFVQEAR